MIFSLPELYTCKFSDLQKLFLKNINPHNIRCGSLNFFDIRLFLKILQDFFCIFLNKSIETREHEFLSDVPAIVIMEVD